MNRIAFFLDQFELQSPGQQLLDRFLIGFKQGGEFQPSPSKVLLVLPRARDQRLIQARVQDFGLEIADSAGSALTSVDGVVIAPGARDSLQWNDGSKLSELIAQLPVGKPVYIDASLLLGLSGSAFQHITQARSGVISSRAAAHLIPLPVRPLLPNPPRKALMIAQGTFPLAELDALFALRPYLPSAALAGAAPRIRPLKARELWAMAYSLSWRPLLEAAVSRSDNVKGDPDRDGRTQDIVGLQLVERLASDARGWLLEGGSLQSLILILNGALADFNVALESAGSVHSAQLYHPQPPMENHYDDLAAWILEQFAAKSGNLPEALFLTAQVQAMQS